MILHIVNQSPFSNRSLQRCLDLMKSDDSLILIGDAVLLLSNPSVATGLPDRKRCFALIPDIEARGMQNKSDSLVNPVHYDGFVDLVEQHHKTLSWL
ncbi:sulfurtransferase complex subunit TusB [Ketobacter sp. MCCC 1A13808]|uniref:sulfurtransferase complex subunit TusB n=1 Tax=Ketobacter sp. MCCC 1A13808 TaxID=2602738 RepID=UPI0012EBD4AB|nr:sulfurtransferase complex subunit TusB [Ketobacter sp. MCCC 1A13808]MVF10576.1 sulfurtransferase complex subunit TusB [Ketobacter sp. MCCC 1A13808]